MDLKERLDRMETAVRNPSFRKSTGRANEVNYWVFDYPPKQELEVRARIRDMAEQNRRGADDFALCVFDLYDMIIEFLRERNFLEKCFEFERKGGMERVANAVGHSMKLDDDDSLIVRRIRENTPENAVVFLTGIGKCYPVLRSHKALNHLPKSFSHTPVVLFFPGTYNEQELILFNELRDENYYRAFRLVR